MKVYDNIHEAYLGTLADVYDNPEHVCAPRGQQIREKLDYTFRIRSPEAVSVVTHDEERNKVIASYTKKECDLYNSKTNSAQDFGKASKFWLKLANPDGTVNSAYGHLIWAKKSHGNPEFETQTVPGTTVNPAPTQVEVTRTPWEWAKHSLIKDKDTRQAILRFNLPEHAWDGNKDFPCTMHANFLIRDNKLNLTVAMRSNDLFFGTVFDFVFFISLMDKMIDELKGVYPDLEKGDYTHMAHSLHIYDRDEEKILKMLGRSKNEQ